MKHDFIVYGGIVAALGVDAFFAVLWTSSCLKDYYPATEGFLGSIGASIIGAGLVLFFIGIHENSST